MNLSERAALALKLSMTCRKCGRKMLRVSEKLEAQMNGGRCCDCVHHNSSRDFVAVRLSRSTGHAQGVSHRELVA